MKSLSFRQLMPHLIAIGTFLLIAFIFCQPAFESNVKLKQDDMVKVEGMRHQLDEYKEKNGHFPLWVTNMFSGMPAYQIIYEGSYNPLGIIDKTLQLWLPEPLNFFFLACICFYILCMCAGIRPFAAILGSLAFAYCTYSPIIITAGHVTKMMALAYSPAMLGGAILLMRRKYLLGFSLLMLFTAMQVMQNHQQITYYVLIILMIMMASFAVETILKKDWGHFLKTSGLMAGAGIIGVAVSAISLLTVYDFAKHSKRGGMLVMDKSAAKGEIVKDGKTTGLAKDYAFDWSYGKTETWSLLIPGVMGYGSHAAVRDKEFYSFPEVDQNSNFSQTLVEKINQSPNPNDQQLLTTAGNDMMNRSYRFAYWGNQPFTNGPVYLGAIVCFLFVLGMFLLDNKYKWWILASCIIAILLAWGRNFAVFNNWVFDHVPLYNKFRAPTMALIIPQILAPLMASLCIEKLISDSRKPEWNSFKKGLIATSVLLILGGFTFLSANFSNENKKRTAELNKLLEPNYTTEQMQDMYSKLDAPSSDDVFYETYTLQFQGSEYAKSTIRPLMKAIQKDRKELFQGSLINSFIIIILAALIIWLFLKRKFINATILWISLTLLCIFDLLKLDMKYLNRYSFEDKETMEQNEFPKYAADTQILNDTSDPNFRVMNYPLSGDETRTSYFHKSIGGYHPAKLGIYDDLIAYQLKGKTNYAVCDMLNVKYILQQPESNRSADENRNALGHAWLVKSIKWVKGPVEEMKALDYFNPKDTAIVDEAFRKEAGVAGMPDSADVIKMTKFDNDRIDYESNTKESRLAVFSEIYYKDWNAYIDGKPAPYFKTNYVLRGMLLPAGKHEISFKFEPKIFFLGKKISMITSWITFLLFLATMYLVWRRRDQKA